MQTRKMKDVRNDLGKVSRLVAQTRRVLLYSLASALER